MLRISTAVKQSTFSRTTMQSYSFSFVWQNNFENIFVKVH